MHLDLTLELSTPQPDLDSFIEIIVGVLPKSLSEYCAEKTNKMLVFYSLYLVDSACIPYLFIFYSYLLWVIGHFSVLLLALSCVNHRSDLFHLLHIFFFAKYFYECQMIFKVFCIISHLSCNPFQSCLALKGIVLLHTFIIEY